MANNNKLKAYVRYDGTGRVIAGSLILQKSKPKVGNWQEIDANECCNDVSTTLTFFVNDDLPLVYPAVTIYCNGTQVGYAYTDTEVTTVGELVNALNAATSTRQFGTYSNAGGGNVRLTVPSSVKSKLCPSGTLTFSIQED
jgi:uncharacterized protein YneR